VHCEGIAYRLRARDPELDLDLLLRCRSGAEQVNVCKWEILTEVGVEVLDQQFGSGLTEAGRADPGHNLLHGGGHTEQGRSGAGESWVFAHDQKLVATRQ
jgi:hypothetical protein